MKKRRKILISLFAIVLAIVLSIVGFNLIKTKNAKIIAVNDNETRRAMTYNEVTDDNGNIDNCEYVKFNSFLRET